MTRARCWLSHKLFRLAAKVNGRSTSGNVAIGDAALWSNVSGTGSTAIGYNPEFNEPGQLARGPRTPGSAQQLRPQAENHRRCRTR